MTIYLLGRLEILERVKELEKENEELKKKLNEPVMLSDWQKLEKENQGLREALRNCQLCKDEREFYSDETVNELVPEK